MTAPDLPLFDDLDLDALRRRQSAKWRAYPADVLPAWVAEMDFPLAEPVADALVAAVRDGDTGYRWITGLPESFAADCARRWGWHVDPGRVEVLPDVVGGAAVALRALTAPGEAVVVTPPVYYPFFPVVTELARRTLVEVPLLRADDGRYDLDLDGLAAAFARPEVTGFLLCNPHNPVGRVFPREHLETVAALATEHGVAVVSDEIHAPLVLPGAEHVPYLSLGEDRTGTAVALLSASKAWNLAGLKASLLVSGSAPTAARLAESIGEHERMSVGHLGVLATRAAYDQGQPWLDRVVATVDRNRALLADLLAERLPGVAYRAPEASYLCWLDCRALGLDDPGEAFLHRGRVAVNRGAAFGAGGEGFVRVNIATSAGILTEVVDRMAAALV